jgi:predicted transcriptional regulator
MIHYKLPLDEEVDADILQWINKFHRTKKGEMVRHAIRYYMAVLEEGETIKFPSNVTTTVKEVKVADTQSAKNKSERRRPSLNTSLK